MSMNGQKSLDFRSLLFVCVKASQRTASVKMRVKKQRKRKRQRVFYTIAREKKECVNGEEGVI